MEPHLHTQGDLDTPDTSANDTQDGAANPDPRRCNYLKDDGTHCRGNKVKMSDRGYCAGHEKLGLAADPVAFAKRGNQESARIRSERAAKAKLSYRDIAVDEFLSNGREIARAQVDAAVAGDWRAGADMRDWLLGKPKETVETITTALDQLTDEQLEARVLELRARMHVVEEDEQAA